MGGRMYKDGIGRGMEIGIFGFNPRCASRATGSGENCRTLSERTVKILHNENSS